MAVLSENSEKEYPKSVTELLRLKGKRFLEGICYLINKISIFLLLLLLLLFILTAYRVLPAR
jgi:hypothetical protein